MTTKGNVSDIGANAPTENSKLNIDKLVDNVLDAPVTKENSARVKGEPRNEPEQSTDALQDELTSTEEDSDETSTEETSDESATEDDDDSSATDDEDVIPASKHRKTLEKMQKRIDAIVAENKALRAKQESATTQESKLEALSDKELMELRDNVDEAIMDAKVSAKVDGTDMTAKINELKSLKKSIDSTVKNAPQRFQEKQMNNLRSMMDEVKDIDPEIVNMKGELWNTLKNVYQRTPSLHSSETGPAEALALATEYYLEKRSQNSGREKASTLSKKVATLKRKTTLDSKTINANQADISSKKLRDKAIRGTYWDKLEYVSKTLVPDEFLH